ncbi:MAG TPA: hypothetical protein VN969_38440 [Streptosporangiaceae bacterium]|nr:hypothetical protein [Streptosporangiaceae bacterium]
MAVMTCEKSDVLMPEGPWYSRAGREPGMWYVLFTVYAAGVALFSGPGQDQYWGRGACAGYAVAAVLALCTRGGLVRAGRMAALVAALAGTVAGPVIWLAAHQPDLPDVTVVLRSGSLLLHHGSPYLGPAQLAHGGWLAYNPYLPVMAVFGLPKALGLPGLLGDTRPWIAIVTLGLLVAAFRVAMGREAGRGAVLGRAAFLLASPVLAFPLSMGITDPPLIALACLGVALAARRRVTAAAIVIAIACAMKETAWPAAAVLAVLVAARYGRREAVRFATLAVAIAAALTAVLAPAALRHPGELFQNTIAYPLGLTAAKSPAQSPLPGHLLSGLGPVGHHVAIALLLASMLGIGVSLLLLPPATARAAGLRLALTLSLMFALCPATRFGYFAYPAALCGWLLMTGAGRRSLSTIKSPYARHANVGSTENPRSAEENESKMTTHFPPGMGFPFRHNPKARSSVGGAAQVGVVGGLEAVAAHPGYPQLGRIHGDHADAAQHEQEGHRQVQPERPGQRQAEDQRDRHHGEEVPGHHPSAPPGVGQVVPQPVHVPWRQPNPQCEQQLPPVPRVAGQPRHLSKPFVT